MLRLSSTVPKRNHPSTLEYLKIYHSTHEIKIRLYFHKVWISAIELDESINPTDTPYTVYLKFHTFCRLEQGHENFLHHNYNCAETQSSTTKILLVKICF